MWLRAASVVQGHLPLALERVQLRVRVGTVAVPRAPRAEHHVATSHRTLVHLPQVNGGEVDLKRSLVAERLEADVALSTFLASDRVDVLCAEAGRVGRGSWLVRGLAGRCVTVAAAARRGGLRRRRTGHR